MGKTERLIPLLREIFGSDMALYADANGYYEVNEAIRVGKLLEENQYAYFEEPVMYDDFEAIKQVADALTIPIANGEQDQSFVNFRWLIANDGVEIVQPDSYYFGGLIRSREGRADGGRVRKVDRAAHVGRRDWAFSTTAIWCPCCPMPAPITSSRGWTRRSRSSARPRRCKWWAERSRSRPAPGWASRSTPTSSGSTDR